MLNKVHWFCSKTAIPVNIIALIAVLYFGWDNYQTRGFDFTVWLPIVLLTFSLPLSFCFRKYGKRH